MRWKDSLLYAWRLGGEEGTNSVAIGESVPLCLTFVPLDKLLVHQISVHLERESSAFFPCKMRY